MLSCAILLTILVCSSAKPNLQGNQDKYAANAFVSPSFPNNAVRSTPSSTANNNGSQLNPEEVNCAKLDPDRNVDLLGLRGKWFIFEVILHLRQEGVNDFRSCPVLTVSLEGYQIPTTESTAPWHIRAFNTEGWERAPRRLRLLWDEAGRTIEYALRFNDTKLGVWSAAARQNGSLVDQQPYNQFVGTVQVIKAVDNHLVLTFCQQQPESQLFSVVLGRDPYGLSRAELRGVHGLLNRRNLPTQSIRKVCGNGANSKGPVFWIVILVAIVAMFSVIML